MSGYSKMTIKGSGPPNVDSPRHWRSLSYRFSSPSPPPPPPTTDNNTNISPVPKFGSILSRTCSSVSRRYRPSSSSDIGNNNQGGGDLQEKLGRAFSLRRSSSVADAYWRIHDVTCDGDNNGSEGKSSGKKRRGNKLINACKRILGIKSPPEL